YAKRIYAYDMKKTVGLLARRTKISSANLLPLPPGTTIPLERWAPVLRYFTAWDNWKVSYACWRAQMDNADPAEHLVFGWGGGVVAAELELAAREGFKVAMTVSSQTRAEYVTARGITPVLRTPTLSESALLRAITELSNGRGAAIFLDNIGGRL